MSHDRVGPQLTGIGVGDSSAGWVEAGFEVDGGHVSIGPLTVSLGAGISWSFQPGVTAEIDGIRCSPSKDPVPRLNPNGANRIDHVVVRSPELDRTTAALSEAGFELRRAQTMGQNEQRFFWAGTTIIELVGPTIPAGDGPATIWGLALVADDLEESKAFLGTRLSDPRDAVQPGRRIAAIRTRELGISLTIALMTPHVRGI